MDKQIVELQTRLTFQENTILELSDVLARQQQEIAALTTKLELVQQQVREVMETGAREEESPPPHY